MTAKGTLADGNVGEGLRGFVLALVDQHENAPGDTLKLKKACVRGNLETKN